MTKKLYLPLLLASVVVLSSCSKKMGALSSDYFTVTPQVLETAGGKVPATINGKFPAKYFNKKAVVTVTPVLRWNGGQAKGESTTFQGEKVESNYQTISYKVGGNYTMKTNFDYVPEMDKSELFLDFTARVGSKQVSIPYVKIADGVISTSELFKNTVTSANVAEGEDAFQRIIKDKREAQIMFLINQSDIRSSELKGAKDINDNAKELNNADNRRIDNIEISAYASPDGALDLNQNLAEKRQDNTANVINRGLKKDKVEAVIDTKYTAEDWEGFKELVEKSNLQDKDLILSVLSMYKDPEQREQEIKNISTVYKNLADDILPKLRRSRITLNYEIIGKSDEELIKLALTDPDKLNVEELLYAASELSETTDEQKKILNDVVKKFPTDYRAYNNLGMIAYYAGDTNLAENYFNKAAQINANAPEVNNNLALVALGKGDVQTAQTLLGKASGAKVLDQTLGNLYIAQGQYERAVNAFGDAKTNSAALAQLLAKDYNKAKNTLSNVTMPDAYTDYLMAVLGARTNNSSLVISSLKAAIAKDSSLARKAAGDLEFAKYAQTAMFKNLIK